MDRQPPVEEQVVIPEPVSESEAEKEEPRPRVAPPPRRKPDTMERQEALATVDVEIEPESLIGADPIKAVRLLGAPDEVREEPPATVWAFREGECQVELYFYLDLESERLKTLGYEIYAPEDTADSRQLCLNRLVNRGKEAEANDV